MTRWLLAALHLFALAIGFGAVLNRAGALRGPFTGDNVRRIFTADTVWGLAGFLWIATGLLRAFAGFEKGTAYYLGNHVFLTKMALLVVLLVLEVRAVITIMRWRRAGRDVVIEPARAASLSRISYAQAGLVVLMLLAATAMARGIG